MSAIALDRVSKHWGAFAAVDDASFRGASGRFIVLLGPSGCGKSTTLRMIEGLDTPSSGRILIEDRDVTHLAPGKRRISMVGAVFPTVKRSPEWQQHYWPISASIRKPAESSSTVCSST